MSCGVFWSCSCPNFLWFSAMKDFPAVNWRGLLTFTLFWRVLIVFPLRVINKPIKLSLFEQVTGDEFAKIRRQYLAFTLDKRNHSGELTGISNYRFDVVQHTNVDFFPNLSLSISTVFCKSSNLSLWEMNCCSFKY